VSKLSAKGMEQSAEDFPLCTMHYAQLLFDIKFLGGYTGGVTPVPIPNTEVKLSRADDTMIVRSWESRTLPGIFFEPIINR
jgi:hypothetical protein